MTTALERYRERRRAEEKRRGRIPAEIVEGFREYCCPVCLGDVLQGLGLACITQGLPPLSQEMRVCGPAVTMRLIAARSSERWEDDEFLGRDLIDIASPGDALIFDVGGRLDAGPWGSNLSIMARQKGLAGTVVDGVIRDSEKIVSAGYPVFARGRAIRHSHGVFYSTSVVSEPVQIGTASPTPTMIRPGDLVVGGVDGICVVPTELAERVLPLYRERHEIDVQKHEGLLAGRSMAEVNVDLDSRTRLLEGLGDSEEKRRLRSKALGSG